MVAVETGSLAESHATICTNYTCFFYYTVFSTYAAFSHSTDLFLLCWQNMPFKPPSRRFSGSFIGGRFYVFGDWVGSVEFEAKKKSSLPLLCPSLSLQSLFTAVIFSKLSRFKSLNWNHQVLYLSTVVVFLDNTKLFSIAVCKRKKYQLFC